MSFFTKLLNNAFKHALLLLKVLIVMMGGVWLGIILFAKSAEFPFIVSNVQHLISNVGVMLVM